MDEEGLEMDYEGPEMDEEGLEMDDEERRDGPFADALAAVGLARRLVAREREACPSRQVLDELGVADRALLIATGGLAAAAVAARRP